MKRSTPSSCLRSTARAIGDVAIFLLFRAWLAVFPSRYESHPD